MSKDKPLKWTDPYLERRRDMVESQMEARGLTNPRVLQAMLQVPRHLFVPDDSMAAAYGDHPLSIGCGQTISQPYIVAYMIEALRLKEDDKVLEIGTGSGYEAAILSKMVKEVYSLEVVRDLAESAQRRLHQLGYSGVHIYHRDGFQGLNEQAPYDAIIVSAAPAEVPQNLIDQMTIGGRMIIPVGSVFQELYLVTKGEKGIDQKRLLPVQFVPMVKGRA